MHTIYTQHQSRELVIKWATDSYYFCNLCLNDNARNQSINMKGICMYKTIGTSIYKIIFIIVIKSISMLYKD